jgi:hypothetical protein
LKKRPRLAAAGRGRATLLANQGERQSLLVSSGSQATPFTEISGIFSARDLNVHQDKRIDVT